MKTKMINSWLLGASIALVACGGAKAGSGLGGGKPPAPTPISGPTANGGGAPAPVVSTDAKKDYESALAFFSQNDKGSWNEGACKGAADRFEAVAREHKDLVAAQFMAGLSYHRCGLLKEAEAAYQAATKMKGDSTKIAMAQSNLGEIYYRSGKPTDAKAYWDSAVKGNGKLIAARINIATLELDEMRKLGDKDSNWKKLEEDARFNLSNVLGVDSDSYQAYTVYGLVYMEGWQRNKNRLDLAKLLLDEGKKRNEKYAPLQNAYGLYYMRRNALSLALQHFQAAVEADPTFAEARMNVGLTTLGFRNYAVAKEQFSKVIELQPKNYDALNGLGAALRGLKDLDGAEAQYKKAIAIDSKRGEAYYNLAVLYKDFRASKQEDLRKAQDTYRQAKSYFNDFLGKTGDATDKAEATDQVKMIDKTIAQLEQFIKAQANMPPAPPATPTPAPAPAPK